ncbi:MAG: DUF6989 domain-containing protein [Candidatus Hodarchaeota archaeon]
MLIPIDLKIGIRLFILVIIYNLAIPIVGLWRKHLELVKIWLFAFIISLFQVFPDWFLSAQLEILVFPEDGLFKIGTVSGYMLLLWAIPLFIILFVGQRVQERHSLNIAYFAVGLLSLLIFGISEMTMWTVGSWYAQNVTMMGHMAVYIIIPEIILGFMTYYTYLTIQEKNHWLKIPAAFIVMLVYLGSAAFFYFLIERVIIS